MSKNDHALMRPGDIAVALSLLTRLPVPGQTPFTRGGLSAWAYPVAGLVVALITGAAAAALGQIGLDPAFSALILMGIPIILTGAMHVDGLADTADGLWGGWDREKRLEIMKDSHIGTYGVIAIFLVLSWHWAALFVLVQGDVATVLTALIAAALLSRAAMIGLMALLPHARTSGLSHSVGQVPRATAGLGIGLACLGAVALLGQDAGLAIMAAALVTVGVGMIARKKIGGQTGDILGAAQQLVELAVLTSLVA